MDQNTAQILKILEKMHPNAQSELKFDSPFQLLVCVILSAQCTDARVNAITPALFKIAPTPQKMAELSLETLEKLIFSCGFYKIKANSLKTMSRQICQDFGGEVPNAAEDLETLAGVGRKTANVVRAVAFGQNAIAVDTHVFRVSNRLGIAPSKTVFECEKLLMKKIDENLWSSAHHWLLLFGRYTCKSARPLCRQCPLTEVCVYDKKCL